MYDDEARDERSLTQLVSAEFARDVDRLHDEYAVLVSREAASRERLKAADREREQLERLRRETAELSRRLGSANAALDAYRAETTRLKGDLKRVRGSRSYKLGRLLSRPTGLVRSLAGPAGAPGSRARGSADHPHAVEGQHAVDGQGVRVASAPQSNRRLSDYTYAELQERFEEQPTPARLGHVLTRAWYQEGLVEQPAALVAAHPEIVGALGKRDAELAERILAADRIRREGIAVPARGRGAAYVPERGRVLYCVHSTPAFNTNGYSLRTRGVARGLKAAGADVVVAARAGYPWDTRTDIPKPDQRRHVVQVDDVEYVHLTGGALARTATDHYVFQCADSFVREARMQRPSAIQAASNYLVGLSALIAARRLGVPFVYEVRGLWEITEASDKPGWESTERFRLQAYLETLVAREADAVLAITPQTRDELVRRGVDPERITLAPNAVDPGEFIPLPRDDAYAAVHDVRADVPVIGFAGSIVPYEGLDVLVDAVALLRDRGVAVQVALAGSGSAEAALREQVTELDLNDRVRFLGRVPSGEVPRLISLFDIMPCPRVSTPVTRMVSPLKPLEALSSAKAVVLSDVAPHLEIAGDDATRAALFSAGDSVALADVLESLVRDPDRRRALGRRGRLWCLDERTWSAVGETMHAVHAIATERADRLAAQKPGKQVHELKIGLVADEFTTATLRPSCEVIALGRARWRDQLTGLDLVLIESAWEGNERQWHRGVGCYSPEEHRDLVELLSTARESGIPTVFWNKEDPIHFERFVPTASLCDHVFTSDADKILDYAAAGAGRVRSVSSLPFYAQPRIHNPLPGARPFEMTASYAGTYYGDRYAERSQELSQLLETARPFGLAIYDRQAAKPDSPYRFPPAFAAAVRGSLAYADVVDSYKAHVVSLNVNSVTSSPTMFSRRVVEVAASGGVVLSGKSRGIEETLGSAIPASSDPLVWRALLRLWTSDPAARLLESWLQMRTVLRAHTVESALTIMARTAGLSVTSPPLDSYAVVVDGSRTDVLDALLSQSVLPAEIWAVGDTEPAREAVAGSPVRVIDASTGITTSCHFVGRLDRPVPRTWFEDMLLAQRFGPWDRIEPNDAPSELGDSLAAPVPRAGSAEGLVTSGLVHERGGLDGALLADGVTALSLRVVPSGRGETVARQITEPVTTLTKSASDDLTGRRVLVAGHDLKFATGLLTELQRRGACVTTDVWASHAEHSEERSRELLADADIVFCEWGLGNAVWYARHIRPDQRLVVRVHLQELQRPYLSRIEHDNVSAFVFVGDLIREAAVRGHGVPAERSHVVPNYVDTQALALPKTEFASRTLGLVGIVPQRKRLDLALDVLQGLHDRGLDYRLRVKGKTPSDYPWMADRPDEAVYYEAQFDRIDAINAVRPGAVVLDGHGDDMVEWYREVGVVLSVSDFESFHLTIADGAASGAMPALLAWDGSDLVYPREWLHADVDAMVRRIAEETPDPDTWRAVARERFDSATVVDQLVALVIGRNAARG